MGSREEQEYRGWGLTAFRVKVPKVRVDVSGHGSHYKFCAFFAIK